MTKGTILVANRGEIACRIIRTIREYGYRSIAVYSSADQDAAHVQMADEAIEIGPAPARESYLCHENLLDAARKTASTAIHPGYGFLAESAGFAQSVLQAGLIWIGPDPETIRNMGDKECAREIAKAAGVPVLPGSVRFKDGHNVDLTAAGRRLGYPLLVKATAGGGGVGLRRIEEPSQLEPVVEAMQAVAVKAFSDSSVYLEKYVSQARHIEVQVFGDGTGYGVHLYDRDCSVQRRFQKVIEEGPAPGLSVQVRQRMHEAALALVSHQKYSGAGTVEFIYDVEHDNIYFLEMNTRIQVEHPVSEMLTGTDLVAWQILQAHGQWERTPQEQIISQGHALECRIYAERPERNFMPSPGTITELKWPAPRAGMRIDTAVRQGDKVTPYYDPMIAKMIFHAADRAAAIAGLTGALRDLTLAGISTNVGFLIDVLSDAEFARGCVTTGYVEAFMAGDN